MISNRALLIPLMLASVALAGCGRHHEENRGPVVTETRQVAAFDSIAIRGGAELRIRIGESPSVTLEGRERVVQRTSTEVEGSTLHIRSTGKDWVFDDGGSLTVNITMPKLSSLKLEGGADVRLNGFDGGDSTIEIEGAAHLKANGHIDALTIHLAGAGHADLRDLVASKAKVTVDGVGSVYVHSTESLDATMNGVGAIIYSGTPREVNTSMNGIGTISKDRDGRRRDRDRKNDEQDVQPEERKPIDPETLQPEYEKKDVKADTTPVV